MAAIGKIRSWGPLLVIIIGLGLFGFIAGDMFRSCETTGRMSSNRVGQILGENINAQDYQEYQNEFVEFTKMSAQQQMDEEQLRQMAWQSFVTNKIVENETSKIGLSVTNEEIKSLMEKGSPMLNEIANLFGFVNEQTGKFDKNKYDTFNSQKNAVKDPQQAEAYEKGAKLLEFKLEELKDRLLAQKYQVLIQNAVLSNPIEAKFAFDAEKQESDIQLAYIEYKSVKDDEIKVTEDDIKAKYNELKERYETRSYNGSLFGIKIPEEQRNVKYILVKKEASQADRDELYKALAKCADRLKEGEDPEKVTREGRSDLSYLGVPVTKKVFNTEIANKIDSMAVGEVVGPLESKIDNSLNVVKLISKTSLPDSVEFRVIGLSEGKGNIDATADSIFKAIGSGGDFEAIAKNYGQTGQKEWFTTASYERASNIGKDENAVINTLNNMAVNEVKIIPQAQGRLVVQVTDKRAMTTKYDVAIVKREIRYSTATSDEITNKFNQFIAGHKTLEAMEKDAAKAGYQVLESNRITTSAGMIPNIPNSRDALKWVFEADVNDISEVFNCGANRDELLVLALTSIAPKGYLSLDNPDLKEKIKQEVIKDKKAELLAAKLKDVKSIDAAKAKGAQVVEDGVKQITFAAPVFIPATQSSEPALSGAVAATEKGKFSAKPVKGNSAVYVFLVEDRRTLEGKYDEKEYKQRMEQDNLGVLMNYFFTDLLYNAELKDNRYLFF
ncbi:MAG: SurA N-terminal domain-containing protein [Prevotella sp.]|nr:SurA N-terminal domain-containing protein [Prevotella sp.]